MKQKYIFQTGLLMLSVSILLASCSRYTVYSVHSKPASHVAGGLLYALPYTQVRVAVTFNKTDYKEAPYADYAHDLLGLSNVGSDSLYSIGSIEISTQNQADPNAYYFVSLHRTTLCVDSRGLLRSIGLPASQTYSQNRLSNADTVNMLPSLETLSTQATYNLYDRSDTFYTRNDKVGAPSYVTSKKDVRSLKQRAVSAAERIEDIREKKQQLLFGEYEGNYGTEAIQYIYNQLERQEQQLLQQFTGKTVSETVVFLVNPTDAKALIDSQTVELFRFSPERGLVDSTDTMALVVRCNVRCENNLRIASRFVRFRTKAVYQDNWQDRHTYKYRIPETATVTVYGEQLDNKNAVVFNFQKQVKIAQFGSIANMPLGKYQALFDSNTGDLIFFNSK